MILSYHIKPFFHPKFPLQSSSLSLRCNRRRVQIYQKTRPFYMKRICSQSHHHYKPLSSSALDPYPYRLAVRQYHCYSDNKQKWQSKTNVIIKNPTMLTMERCNTMTELKQIQARMTRNGLIADTFPASRVLAFCAISDSGDLRHARALFVWLHRPNAYMWNTMIRGCYMAGFPEMGFEFFVRMVRSERVEIDGLSFIYALKACEKAMTAKEGGSVICVMRKKGFDGDLAVRNGMIRFWSERGCILDARKVFDEIPVRDVVTWTTLIDGYSKRGFWDEALEVFEVMCSSGIDPNEVTMVAVLSACGRKGNPGIAERVYDFALRRGVNRSLHLLNCALDAFAKCGSVAEAMKIFDRMKTRDVFSWTTMINGYAKLGDLDSARKFFDETPHKNAVSWSAMIAGYSQNDRPEEALRLFHEMRTSREGFVPAEHALSCALSSCARLGRLDLGLQIHRQYMSETQPSTILTNALVDMYGKCGSIAMSASLFDKMQDRSLISWNTMIACYAAHGYADRALSLFDEMKTKIKPDDVTYVAVLSACSHAGLVSAGLEYFESMGRNFGLEPKAEHYACIVDLLARVGLLKEAYGVIVNMPMEAGESAWGALLGACKVHGNAELAEIAAQKLLELGPHDSGVYVSLATALANEKKWKDVRRVRGLMRENGVEKSPGRSSVEIDGDFREFLAGDESHTESQEMYEVLNCLYVSSNLEDHELNLNYDYDFLT